MDAAEGLVRCINPITETGELEMKWSYNSSIGNRANGFKEPNDWGCIYPPAKGTRQSPINVDTSMASRPAALKDNPLKINVSRNHTDVQRIMRIPHNFAVKVEGNGTLEGGPLKKNEIYRLDHFMFKIEENGGSEHTINNKSYPAELQMYFYNTKYNTIDRASDFEDGVACVIIMYELNHFPQNDAIYKMLQAYYSLNNSTSNALVSRPIDIPSLYPADTTTYYTYRGSLTAPPCTECVTYIILKDRKTMQATQLDKLLQVHRERGCCRDGGNCRPLQATNGRCICYGSKCACASKKSYPPY